MISPYKIEWLHKTSLEFDCWTEIAFESGDNGECESFLNRESVFSESFNGTSRRVHSYKYGDVMSPKITFVKKNYEDFTDEENRAVLSWLTGTSKTSVLSIYKDDSEVISYELIGNFIEVQQYKMSNGRVVGYTATFEANTPYMLSPVQTVTKTVTAPTTFTINCETDDYDSLVYPKITITENSSSVVVNITSDMVSSIFNNNNYLEGTVYHYNGTYYWKTANNTEMTQSTNTSGFNTTSVYISNETTGVSTYVKNRARSEVIVIDGANRLISNGGYTPFADNFKWQWIGLKYGINTLKIIGNCTVEFKYREPIKCGEF